MKILLAVLMVLTMASLSSAQQPQTSADVIFVQWRRLFRRAGLRNNHHSSH